MTPIEEPLVERPSQEGASMEFQGIEQALQDGLKVMCCADGELIAVEICDRSGLYRRCYAYAEQLDIALESAGRIYLGTPSQQPRHQFGTNLLRFLQLPGRRAAPTERREEEKVVLNILSQWLGQGGTFECVRGGEHIEGRLRLGLAGPVITSFTAPSFSEVLKEAAEAIHRREQ